MDRTNFKVGLVQHKAAGKDRQENAKLFLAYCKLAKKKGADIVLFPEVWFSGYTPPFCNEDCISQADIDCACETAKMLQLAVVMTGLTKGRTKPRNTAIVISATGEVLMKYDKVHTCDFGFEGALESGDSFEVCEIMGVKIGVMICYDREFPESARVLMLKGAEIILVPNACDMNAPRLNQLSTRAFENMTGVAMANYPDKNWGNSCGFSPIMFGEEGDCPDTQICMADHETEDIFIAEFDMKAIRRYREAETWGNAYRKVRTYQSLLDTGVSPPFVREDSQI